MAEETPQKQMREKIEKNIEAAEEVQNGGFWWIEKNFWRREAKRRYVDAARLAEKDGMYEEAVEYYTEAANIAFSEENYDEASEYCESAYDFLNYTNDSITIINLNVLLGDIYTQQGNQELAKEFYSQAGKEFSSVSESNSYISLRVSHVVKDNEEDDRNAENNEEEVIVMEGKDKANKVGKPLEGEFTPFALNCSQRITTKDVDEFYSALRENFGEITDKERRKN